MGFSHFHGSFSNPSSFKGEVRRGMGYIWRCSIKQFIFKLVVQLIYYFLFSPLSRIPPFYYSIIPLFHPSIISLFSSTFPSFLFHPSSILHQLLHPYILPLFHSLTILPVFRIPLFHHSIIPLSHPSIIYPFFQPSSFPLFHYSILLPCLHSFDYIKILIFAN